LNANGPTALMLLLAALPAFATPAALADHPTTQPAATQQIAAAPATQPRAVVTTTTRDPLTDLPSYGQMLRRTAYTLFFIIAALLIAAKVLPRWLGKMPLTPRGRMIEVVEFHRLEPRKGIYLIRVVGQYYLVGSTGDRLETLAGGPLDQEKIAAALGTGPATAATRPRSAALPTSDAPSGEAKRSFVEVLRGKRAGDEFET
jgi:flagellar biogenesis protein FliO